MGIKYWEIWNEPDLTTNVGFGTPEEFYELSPSRKAFKIKISVS